MEFQGTGKRLSRNDVGDAAREIGIETAVLLSFMEVEASGHGFDNQDRPKMLFEPHIFHRKLGKGLKRENAIGMGLAYVKWKPGNYPRDSYPRLKDAVSISTDAALKSASYGLGQIMGFNHVETGCATPQDMFEVAKRGEREQLLQLVALMKSWNMVSMLTNKDFTNPDSWRGGAKKWNGSGYAKHGYHVKLAKAYVKHTNGTPMKIVPAVSMLKILMKGEAVRNLQADLAALGYLFVGGIDGRFGAETEKNVKNFQRDKRLEPDGIAGKKTLDAIKTAMKKLSVDNSPDLPIFDKNKVWWIELILAFLKGFK